MDQTNDIQLFFQCRQCLEEISIGVAGTVSPRDYGKMEIGWTEKGIQVRCVRHELEIVSLDFLGQKIQVDQGPDCISNARQEVVETARAFIDSVTTTHGSVAARMKLQDAVENLDTLEIPEASEEWFKKTMLRKPHDSPN